MEIQVTKFYGEGQGSFLERIITKGKSSFTMKGDPSDIKVEIKYQNGKYILSALSTKGNFTIDFTSKSGLLDDKVKNKFLDLGFKNSSNDIDIFSNHEFNSSVFEDLEGKNNKITTLDLQYEGIDTYDENLISLMFRIEDGYFTLSFSQNLSSLKNNISSMGYNLDIGTINDLPNQIKQELFSKEDLQEINKIIFEVYGSDLENFGISGEIYHSVELNKEKIDSKESLFNFIRITTKSCLKNTININFENINFEEVFLDFQKEFINIKLLKENKKFQEVLQNIEGFDYCEDYETEQIFSISGFTFYKTSSSEHIEKYKDPSNDIYISESFTKKFIEKDLEQFLKKINDFKKFDFELINFSGKLSVRISIKDKEYKLDDLKNLEKEYDFIKREINSFSIKIKQMGLFDKYKAEFKIIDNYYKDYFIVEENGKRVCLSQKDFSEVDLSEIALLNVFKNLEIFLENNDNLIGYEKIILGRNLMNTIAGNSIKNDFKSNDYILAQKLLNLMNDFDFEQNFYGFTNGDPTFVINDSFIKEIIEITRNEKVQSDFGSDPGFLKFKTKYISLTTQNQKGGTIEWAKFNINIMDGHNMFDLFEFNSSLDSLLYGIRIGIRIGGKAKHIRLVPPYINQIEKYDSMKDKEFSEYVSVLKNKSK